MYDDSNSEHQDFLHLELLKMKLILILLSFFGSRFKNQDHVILYDVITKKGIPLLFHTDAAKELLLGASQLLTKLLGYQQTDTKGYNPQANAKMERV